MEMALSVAIADDTRAVGEAIAELLQPRDTVILSGELGAGKTTFVQGLARGLGITDQVVSPTFTLVKEYSGRLHLAHVDVYRLDRIQDVVDLDLDELGTGEGVVVVEWGDAVEELLPPDRLRVQLTTMSPDGPDEGRRIVMSSSCASWALRWERAEQLLRAWMTS
jgi:tRNA threonylcarbamoyladenosine biosynthesis protein TsaE